MANLKNRIKKLTNLRGTVKQKGINSLDLFLAGALAGLYSKKLFISNDIHTEGRKSPNPEITVKKNPQQFESSVGEYSNTIKPLATSERLSSSVSDYVLKLEKQDYIDYSRGFYTSQVDNIAKVFSGPTTTISLTNFAKQPIPASQVGLTARQESTDKQDLTEEYTKKSARESDPEKTDEIEKASGSPSKEPTYQEILDTFEKGLQDNPLENDKSVKKEADVLKTAEANPENFPSQSQPELKDNQQFDTEQVENASSNADLPLKSEDPIELAQADAQGAEKNTANQANTTSTAPSGAEAAANAAASAPSSIFGSIAMVPVAAVGIQQVVSRVAESFSEKPQVVIEENPIEVEEPIAQEPVVEEPVVTPPAVIGTNSSPEVAAAPEPVLAFQGRVVDGYVVGATVFYDENNNGILDDSESNYVGVTDADGNFQLPDFSAASQDGSVVVLPGGVDTNTGHKIGAMQVNVPKDADGNPILSDPDSGDGQVAISSPLTLILAQNSDIVEADLIAQLGMNGVEEKGLAFYDPVSEMQAGNNNSLAEYVFTVQQQLFSVIQAGSKIAGSASGLSALEVSVQAVGDAMKTALENGTALTIDNISDSAIAAVANGSGFSNLATNLATIVRATNEKIAEGYSGMAVALSDPTNDDSITLLSNARATAAASQDTLLSSVDSALSSGSLDTAAFSTSLASGIAENSAVFGTLLQAEAGDGSSGLSEFGNPSFIVSKFLEQTGTTTRDVVDLSSSINTLSLETLSQLGAQHVRLLGSNTSVEISLGNVSNAALAALNDDATTDDTATTLVDESAVDDGLFASNYTVTLKVTDAQVASVVANATALNAAGIDVIKPVEGTLSLTLAQVRELQSLGFEFASGLVRFSASTSDSLTFDEAYTLLNSGLKLTDASEVSVSIPDGDSRSTFSTIKDLASRGVSFDGGTITLEQTDLKGSYTVLQSQLLDAAKSNIVFDTDSVSSWSLGKASDGTSLGNPKIDASDVTYLVNAGIAFNNATVNVKTVADVQSIVDNAFEILSSGVKKFNFSPGISISTSDARTILDAKDLTIEQGVSYTDTIFSGEGVLSNLGDASLQSLSDFLAEGLGLDTSFIPEYSDALALVQLGITFPQGITLQTTADTTITLSNANILVNAGVQFQGPFNVIFEKESSSSESQNLTAVSNLVNSGLRPTTSDGQKISITGSNSEPLYIRPTEWNALKDYVDLGNASLVLTRSSDFLTAFGDLTNNETFWTSQTQFSKFAVPMSVTPVYSQLKTLADLNTKRGSDGVDPISLVRVSKTSNSFSELNTDISIRISSQADLDAVDVVSLKNSGVDSVDVFGVPLSVSQIEKFMSESAPLLQNAQLLISNANVSDASALLQRSFDRDIFDAGITGFGVASGTSTTADVWKTFSDAYDSLAGDANSATTRIFDGGVITGAGGLQSGVGQVLDRLGRAGLKLADSYAPSLTEVREYIDGGGSYTKGIKISLQGGESLGPNEAIALAQANVSFSANTPLDFTGQTKDTLSGASTEAQQVEFFKKLIDKGFLLQNVEGELLTLDNVTVKQDVFDLLNKKGFTFSNSKIQVGNKMELVSAAVKLASTNDHGISHLQVPETMVPSFGQAKLLLGAGLSFEMISSTGDVVGLGATIKANSVSQLESLARQVDSLETMGVSSLDLEGLNIPVNVAKIFVDASSSTNITFLNQPKLLIKADDSLSEVPSFLNGITQLGVREITFDNNVEVNAKDANDIILASNQITFSNGFISNSDGVADEDLKGVLGSLKAKGMFVSPTFKPSLSATLTGNSQTDTEAIVRMMRDGYKVKINESDGVSGTSFDETGGIVFSNVFATLKDYQRLSNSENYGENVVLPKFNQSYVVAKNQQELNSITSELGLEMPSLEKLGVTGIATQGSLSPSLTDIQAAGSKGLSFSRVDNSDGSFSLLTGPNSLITLKLNQAEISSVANNPGDVIAAGLQKINLFGKEIDADTAKILVDTGFTFEGGKVSSVSDPQLNTLNYLQPLAAAGLGLPSDMTLKDSTVPFDFAMNRFKGSLEGASIDLSDKQDSNAIELNQIMRLVNRDLGSGLNVDRTAFVAETENVAVQVKITTPNNITENTASRLDDLGFSQVVGEMNVKTSLSLMSNQNLDLTRAEIKGTSNVQDVVSIIDNNGSSLINGIELETNSKAALVDVKKIMIVENDKINLNDLTLDASTISPNDLIEVGNRITLASTTTVDGEVSSVEDAQSVVLLMTNNIGNVVLKSETEVMQTNAEKLVPLIQNSISIFDGVAPTVQVSDSTLSVENALILGNARADLNQKSLDGSPVADIEQATQLASFDGFNITGLQIERGEELKSSSKENIFSLRDQGVVFNSATVDSGLFTINEIEINPIEALDLNSLGAVFESQVVVIDGDGLSPGAQVPGSVAVQLSSIEGLDLSRLKTHEEGLSIEQIDTLESKGVAVNVDMEVVSEGSRFNGSLAEESNIDPIGTGLEVVAQGNIILKNDNHSVYHSEISGNNLDHQPGRLDLTFGDQFGNSLQEVTWTYSVSASDIEYLSDDELLEVNYDIKITDEFFGVVGDELNFGIQVGVLGTDDLPEIFVASPEDVDVLLREGMDTNGFGSFQVFERDHNDQLSFSVTSDSSTVDPIEMPIEFLIKNTETNEVLWEADYSNFVAVTDGLNTEIIGPTLEAGNYDFDWYVSDTSDIFDNLLDGEVSENDFTVKIASNNLGNGSNPSDLSIISQDISIDFQANSAPALQGSNGETPTLRREGIEDVNFILTPEEFGYTYYFDKDADPFSEIEIVTISDGIDIFYNVDEADFSPNLLLEGDKIGLYYENNFVNFTVDGLLADVGISPSENVNGLQFIDFNAGDGIEFTSETYRSEFFLLPVVDAPTISTGVVGNDTHQENLKFISDGTEIYLQIDATGPNSEIIRGNVSLQQGDIVIHNEELSTDDFRTEQTIDLTEIVNKHEEIAETLQQENSRYDFTKPLEAHIVVEAQDVVGQHRDVTEFELREDIIIIPDASKIKNENSYQEVLFGFSDFDVNPSTNFSEFGESDDTTYIDPAFGKVISTNEEINGVEITSDPDVIIGTKGDDFIFANSSKEDQSGTVIHGGEGFDDLSGGEYNDIIYIDILDSKQGDNVSGGKGDDVFVIHSEAGSGANYLLDDDRSKEDMNSRLENLLVQNSIDKQDVAVAATIDDFSLSGENNVDSIVLSGFSEESEYAVYSDDDLALLLVEDDSQEKLYTAAILMPEYGIFNSTDMDLMNDTIHRI